MEQVELMNLCMITDAEGRVLVQDRVKPGWTGLSFPGGHIEPGESLIESTIREIKEETGLTIRNLKLCGIKDWINEDGSRGMVICYKTSDYEGERKDSEEGQVFWIHPKDLKNRNLVPDMEITLEMYNDELQNELFNQ